MLGAIIGDTAGSVYEFNNIKTMDFPFFSEKSNYTDFESAIRLAVSLGGDSDTLACITGGIAEAFYKEIPAPIATGIWGLLPDDFKAILKEMEAKTPYRLPEVLHERQDL